MVHICVPLKIDELKVRLLHLKNWLREAKYQAFCYIVRYLAPTIVIRMVVLQVLYQYQRNLGVGSGPSKKTRKTSAGDMNNIVLPGYIVYVYHYTEETET